MKKFGAKHLVSAVVATATVVSVGCIAIADEIDTTVDEAAGAVAVAEETAETEEVQVQEEEATVVDNGEAVADEVVADETEEVVAETADAAEVDEVIEDETVYEVEEVIVSEEADYAVTNGWVQDSYGDYYYYKNGKSVTGWQLIDGKYYYFLSGGKMYIGGRYDSEYKAYFIFGIKGDMLTGWVEYDDEWFYCDPKTGKAATGWKKIDNNYYCFSNSTTPEMYSDGIYIISDEIYLFSSTGEMLTGWQYYNGWYYFSKSTGKAFSGWNKIGNEWYYFNEEDPYDPYMYSGICRVPDDKGNYFYYFFDENGVLKTNGWYSNGAQYDVYIDGELEFSGFDGVWYYTNANGRCLTGWQKIDGKWYFFRESYEPYAISGKYKDPDSQKYYFFDRETYAMVTSSWVAADYSYNSDGEVVLYFYVGKDGAAYRGWNKISNNWYYFGPGNSTYEPYMHRGKETISGVTYIFGASGVMRKGGWCQFEGEYYYTDNNGAAYTNGWKTINGKTYYFYSNGVMATGIKNVGGKVRDFGKDGVCRNPG